jgi:hypothetical protein
MIHHSGILMQFGIEIEVKVEVKVGILLTEHLITFDLVVEVAVENIAVGGVEVEIKIGYMNTIAFDN